MKKILLFVLPVLVVVTSVFAVFGFLQARYQEERLMDDLKRKATNVAEGMELSARDAFASNNKRTAQRLADKFQRRERLQGSIFYSRDGKVLAATERISGFVRKDNEVLQKVLSSGESYNGVEKCGDYTLYSHILPVKDDEGAVVGALEVIYDTSYVYTTMTELWERITATLIVLVLLTFAVILLLHRQVFILPVRRMTEWFQKYHRGEIDGQLPMNEKGDLGKLASEVEQVALGLRVARRSVSIDASERLQKEEEWTENKLKDLVRSKLGESALFSVSNREPYMHVKDAVAGKTKCIQPASGVVTALDPVMRACGGMWIAHGSGSEDRKFVNSKNQLGVPPSDPHYILKRVWLSKEEENGYYYGFSNEGLWPLCHITYTRPMFKESDWQMYKSVNQKFADRIVEELPQNNPLVFIQDYHFTLLGKMIKEKRPDAVIALFWHIPWPNPEVFSICPYQDEILDGMLGCDLIGFHVQYHCNNFLDTVNRMVECRVNTEKFSVVRGSRETLVRSFPISVDNYLYQDSPLLTEQMEQIRTEHNLHGKIVGLGVERIDYTKGIVERLQAIDRFLEKYPEYKNRFVFLQLAAPSRTLIKRYHDLMGEIEETVEKVNWKHSENGWKPVVYLKNHFSADEIKPYYALADVCMVSSLHDGMNLVAKEYIASRNDLTGSLILSCFTGASRELVDAVQINPYSIEQFSDAIRYAIEMPDDEKSRRMKNMRKIINDNNVYRWAGSIISELTALRKDPE